MHIGHCHIVVYNKDNNRMSTEQEETVLLECSESILTCQICMERFQSPRILPCQHTFCKACVTSLVKKHCFRKGVFKTSAFPCPNCRTDCKIRCKNIEEAKDLRAFPEHLLMKTLLEASEDKPNGNDNPDSLVAIRKGTANHIHGILFRYRAMMNHLQEINHDLTSEQIHFTSEIAHPLQDLTLFMQDLKHVTCFSELSQHRNDRFLLDEVASKVIETEKRTIDTFGLETGREIEKGSINAQYTLSADTCAEQLTGKDLDSLSSPVSCSAGVSVVSLASTVMGEEEVTGDTPHNHDSNTTVEASNSTFSQNLPLSSDLLTLGRDVPLADNVVSDKIADNEETTNASSTDENQTHLETKRDSFVDSLRHTTLDETSPFSFNLRSHGRDVDKTSNSESRDRWLSRILSASGGTTRMNRMHQPAMRSRIRLHSRRRPFLLRQLDKQKERELNADAFTLTVVFCSLAFICATYIWENMINSTFQ